METLNETLKTVTLNEILFPVYLNDNPRNTNREYSKVVTGIIDGEEKDLNYCSPRYELIPNNDIFPDIRKILFNHGIEFTETYQHLNHGRFYAQYIIEDKRFAYRIGGSNDIVKPQLRVQHSYNGLTKYMISFGYYRVVCSNGLVIPVEEMKRYNLSITGKHTKVIKKSLERLNDTITYFAENAGEITKKITAKYNILANTWVEKWEDRVIEVLTGTKISIIQNKNFNVFDFVKSKIDKEIHLYNGKINDWLIYNAINQYIYSERNIKAPEIRAEMDSKVFELMLS
jgi:hypothetical protein